jgi:hypothetical protein
MEGRFRARAHIAWVALAAAIAAGASLGACSTAPGSSGSASTTASGANQPKEGKASVRLYLLSAVAGALEPCGCSKDQLGGIDHLASFIASERDAATDHVLVAAGPLFFLDPTLSPQKGTQDKWKAEALASSLAKLNARAWAPGANDWAAGAEELKKLRDAADTSPIVGNASEEARKNGNLVNGYVKKVELESGPFAVGVVGISDPKSVGAAAGVELLPPASVIKEKVAEMRKSSNIVVVAAALQRGDALRLVDEVPDIDVLLVGKPVEKGDLNDKPRPAQLVGKTLVVETSNHLQTVAVVDVFIRDKVEAGTPIPLADAGGVARTEEIVGVTDQIRELEHRINGWETDKNVNPKDLSARKAELETLRRKKSSLEAEAPPPPSGSYFRYKLVEVREKLGADKAVADVISTYYKRVNDHNKKAFESRKPEPAAEGQASFMGVDACTSCHEQERAVWNKTAHAHAYATLEKQFVEFNLDCVGCHVTGYEKPGGSTVTHVEKLKDVGCETCHGPGSLHANDPKKKGLIVVKPDPKSCVTECHHPPHVEGFDPVAKMQLVLGPGHGM